MSLILSVRENAHLFEGSVESRFCCREPEASYGEGL